nr:zinc finger protein OZF-like isoform X1 [Biomphalaria glabrata]
MMGDMKQDFTNDLLKVIKIEKIESSPHLEKEESSLTGQTFELNVAKQAKTSEDQFHPRSMMDVMKEQFANDFKNIFKIDKIESSSETQEFQEFA